MRIHISMAPCPVPAPPESTPSRKREKRLDIGRIHERHYELELTVWSPLSTPMARPREFHAEPSSAAGGSIKDKVKIRGSPRVSNEQSIECDQASENQAWLAPSPRRHLPWPYTSQPLHLEKTGKSYHAPLSSLGDTVCRSLSHHLLCFPFTCCRYDFYDGRFFGKWLTDVLECAHPFDLYHMTFTSTFRKIARTVCAERPVWTSIGLFVRYRMS